MKFNSRLIIFTFILIAVTTLCKFFFGPRLGWSGFSPVIAIGLFSGMLINDKSKSFFLPLIAVFASDMIIELLYAAGAFPYSGLYSYQFVNYSLLLATTLVGWALKGRNYTSLIVGSFTAPTLFFLLSNFVAWKIDTHNMYPNTIDGLLNSYVNGLPFYRNALAATFIFLPGILIAYNYIIKKALTLRLA